jgi:hypothetical protein
MKIIVRDNLGKMSLTKESGILIQMEKSFIILEILMALCML